MIYQILSVMNILIAAAMIVLILMQRGAGADAGAAFGGGGSGTVFGARGSATFLSRATGVLAGLFFVVSLTMGMMLEHQSRQTPDEQLGVMSGLVVPDTGAATPDGAVPAVPAPAAAPTTQSGGADVPAPANAEPQAVAPAAEPTSAEVPKPQPAQSGSAG